MMWSEILSLHLVRSRPCPPCKYLPRKSSAIEQALPLKEPSSRYRPRALAFHVAHEAPPCPPPDCGPAALSGFNISRFFYSLCHNRLPFHLFPPYFLFLFPPSLKFFIECLYFSRSQVFNSSNHECTRREGSDKGREEERFHRVSCLRGTLFPGSAHRAPQTFGGKIS